MTRTYGDLLRMALPDALEAALTDRSAVAFRQGLPRNVMSSAGSAQVCVVWCCCRYYKFLLCMSVTFALRPKPFGFCHADGVALLCLGA